MYSWTWEPALLLGIAGQVVAYLALVGPLRRFFPGAEPVPASQQQLFLLGSLTLFIALVSPIEHLGDTYLLTMHMVQHLIITLIVPPLWLVGTPRWLFRPLLRLPYALPVGRLLTNPLVTFLAFNVTFVIWHVPALYDAALQSVPIHALEHVTFIVTATLTWWPIFSPLDELPAPKPPVQCLYLFFQSLPPTLLGALIAFSDSVLYPTYANAPRIWGLTPQTDQQIGGLIMWVPGSLVFFGVLTVIFFRWFSRDEGDYETLEASPEARG